MDNSELMKRYEAAVDSFVDKVRGDPNVIAVIVYGSVVHGTVWEKSDIDMRVVVRDQKLERKSFGICEDDIILNVDLVQRSGLKRGIEGNRGGSIWHSMDATSRIVYTTDESLYAYLEENKRIGTGDMERALFFKASELINDMSKVEKWIKVKHDLTYARQYLIHCAACIAWMEVCSRYETPTREAILQAAKLNPALMDRFYGRPMAGPMTEEEIRLQLLEMDGYLMEHAEALVRVAGECLGDGEIKTGTQVSDFYKVDMHMIHDIFEYLCEKGYLQKLSQTIRITPKSKLAVEEMAFIMLN